MKVWTFVTNGGRYSRDRYMVPPQAEVGDRVVLWRSSRGGSMVATGTIAALKPAPDPHAAIRLPPWGTAPPPAEVPDDDTDPKIASIAYTGFFLSKPVTPRALTRAGLVKLAAAGKTGQSGYRTAGRNAPLHLDEFQWAALNDASLAPRESSGGPQSWSIEPGTVLRRGEVHDFYGGPRGSAECSSPEAVNDLLFVDYRPEDPELIPRWEQDVLMVAGSAARSGRRGLRGQEGVIAHLDRGRALRVFAAEGKLCVYLGEFVIDQVSAIERWVDAGRKVVRRRNAFLSTRAGSPGSRTAATVAEMTSHGVV